MLNRASLVAQMVKNLPAMQETGVWSLVGKIPWRTEWHPTPVFLPGESRGQRALAGYSPWGCRVGQDWATDAQLECWTPCLCFPGKLLEISLHLYSSQQLPGRGSFLWHLFGVSWQLWEADLNLSCMLPYCKVGSGEEEKRSGVWKPWA